MNVPRHSTRAGSRPALLVLTVVWSLVIVVPESRADDYDDPDYRDHEMDNMTRPLGSPLAQATSPDYLVASATAAAQSVAEASGRQISDAPHGRVYAAEGQTFPPFMVGDPQAYNDVRRERVQFLNRLGAKLNGHIWGSEAPGPRPGIVVTVGGLASEQMYWWGAQALAKAGYVVLTFDIQNQGQSETFSRDESGGYSLEGSDKFEDNYNFRRDLVDALQFFLSTDDEPYVPTGWTDEQVDRARGDTSGERIDWVNPNQDVLDHDSIGLTGHSNGAFASTLIQQCSDVAEVWQTFEECGGRSFPIRAVVAWDRLNHQIPHVPLVPGMDQQADYMWSPVREETAPDPEEKLDNFHEWRAAGVDTYAVTIRGGTHLDWTEIPFMNRSTYGDALAAYYTVAWFDRYLHPDPAVRRQGYDALIGGPTADADEPWAANYLSVRFLSAMHVRDPDTGDLVDVVDLREWAGRSPVGDWAGANADTAGRVLP